MRVKVLLNVVEGLKKVIWVMNGNLKVFYKFIAHSVLLKCAIFIYNILYQNGNSQKI